MWPRVNAAARLGCYPWQGQLISMGTRELNVPGGNGKMRHVYPVSQTTYGQPAGIWRINCHHGPMNVFIPGFSYVRGEDVKPDQEKNDRLYQLTQEQRRLEREVRYAKRDAAMYDAAGDREGFEKSIKIVREKQRNLRSFVSSNPSLVRDYSRESVVTIKNGTANKLPSDDKVDIIKASSIYGGAKVQEVAKINLEAYRKITNDLVTDEVIITEKQVLHILEGHPEKEQANVLKRLASTVSDPDYLLQDAHEEHKNDTAIALKYFPSESGGYRAIVRLVTSSDNPDYKNSIITAFFVSKKKWDKYLRNKKIVYTKE